MSIRLVGWWVTGFSEFLFSKHELKVFCIHIFASRRLVISFKIRYVNIGHHFLLCVIYVNEGENLHAKVIIRRLYKTARGGLCIDRLEILFIVPKCVLRENFKISSQ